jgi:N-acetyl-anhydromuramyl-L-alanine amidase AmpD
MSKVDYPGAEEHFVPRSFMFDRNAHKALVIHKTGGDATPQAVYNAFIASGNSVHYAIGTDGTIWQFVPEALGAGGNCCVETGYDPFWTPYVTTYGNLNFCTISIEHCDYTLLNSTLCPQAQTDASFKLVAHLAQKYHIAPDHIKPHSSINPLSRAYCPGNYPFADLLAYVQKTRAWVHKEHE